MASFPEEELRVAQPEPFHPTRTLDLDLYAERLLMLLLSGSVEARLESWAQTLTRMQNADGSWGLPTPEEPPYFPVLRHDDRLLGVGGVGKR